MQPRLPLYFPAPRATAFRVAAAPLKARAIPSHVAHAAAGHGGGTDRVDRWQGMEQGAAAAARSSSLPASPQLMVAVLLLAALLLSPSAVTVACARPTALIVFGDSTVDTGNNNFWPTTARSNFPPYGRDFPGGRATGRFCDGRMASDFLSEALGLRAIVPAYLDPAYGIQDFAIGVNFASAGSGLDVATGGVLNVIPMSKQMEMFREYKSRLAAQLGAAQAEAVLSGAVYAISIGSNDFMENYFSLATPRYLQFTVPGYTSYLLGLARGFMTELHSLGARKIGFASLGPMGCLPPDRARFAGLACDELHNAAAQAFNVGLRGVVQQLRAELPGADVRVGEVYDFFQDMLREPARYGFARADVGCCGTGRVEMGYGCNAFTLTCPDPNAYVFWDAVHLTEHANRLATEYLMNTTYGSFAS